MHVIDLDQRVEGYTGCLPRPMKVGANPRFPVWGTADRCPLIPREEWVTCSLRHKVWEICNQASQSSCCPTAVRGAMQLLRELFGMQRVRLSQGSVYRLVNGGRDAGANIMDALEAMMDTGMATDAVIDEYAWNKRPPDGWEQSAARYKVLEAWDCSSFDAMISAVQRNFPVVFGVNWSGGGGHAVTAIGYTSGKVEILNSWGAGWGDNGTGFLSENQCRAITSYGAFCLRSVTIPSDEILPPVPK